MAKTKIDVRKQAEEIFAKLGLTMDTVVDMLCRQAIMHKGVPFPVVLSNNEISDAESLADFAGMTVAQLDAELKKGLKSANAGAVRPIEDFWAEFEN